MYAPRMDLRLYPPTSTFSSLSHVWSSDWFFYGAPKRDASTVTPSRDDLPRSRRVRVSYTCDASEKERSLLWATQSTSAGAKGINARRFHFTCEKRCLETPNKGMILYVLLHQGAPLWVALDHARRMGQFGDTGPAEAPSLTSLDREIK